MTATRRSERLGRTAIAVTKVDDEQLARSDIRSIADLQFYAPGLVFSQNGAAFTTLRGVGTTQPGSAVESGVATNIDGVYVGRATSVQSYFDLDSIEVLRGPQGTLYGRNATGGAINIASAKPADTFSAGVVGNLGNYARRRLEGFVTGPLSDSVSARVAAVVDDRDSYLDNIAPGAPNTRGDRVTGVRGSVLFGLGDSGTQLSVTIDRQSVNGAGQVPQNILGGFSPSAPAGTVTTTDPTEVAQSLANVSRRDAWGVNVTLEVPLGDVTLKSISAYRSNRWNAFNGLAASSDPRSFIRTNERAHQASEELQLLSADDSRLRWVAGLYYFSEWVVGDYRLSVIVAEPFPIAENVVAGPLRLDEHLRQDFRNQSYAAFGQASYALSERLRITLGARYTRDSKKGTGGGTDLIVDVSGILPSFDVGGPVSVDDDWGAFTPKLGVEFDLAENTLLYASATRGFKPGNSNLTVGSRAIDPEYVWAYEAGLKSRLLEGRMQANLVAFYYDYEDLQVFGIIPGQSGGLVARFQNAAAARVKGFEAEVLARPLPSLELNASYAYLDASYREYFTSDAFLFGQAAPIIDVGGNTMPRSPKHSVNFGAQYEARVGDVSVVPRLEYIYRSKMYFSQFEHENTAQDAYSLWNARVGLTSTSGIWHLAVFGKNLRNEHYLEQVNEGTSGNAGGFFAAPRTYGIEIGANF